MSSVKYPEPGNISLHGRRDAACEIKEFCGGWISQAMLRGLEIALGDFQLGLEILGPLEPYPVVLKGLYGAKNQTWDLCILGMCSFLWTILPSLGEIIWEGEFIFGNAGCLMPPRELRGGRQASLCWRECARRKQRRGWKMVWQLQMGTASRASAKPRASWEHSPASILVWAQLYLLRPVASSTGRKWICVALSQ